MHPSVSSASFEKATGQGSSGSASAEGCLAAGDTERGSVVPWSAGPATLNLLQARVWGGRRAAVIQPLVGQQWLSHGHCPHGDEGLKTKAASDPDVLSLQCPTSISQVLPFSPTSVVLWSRGCVLAVLSWAQTFLLWQAQPLLSGEGWGGTVAVTAFLLHAVQGHTNSACASSLTGL